MKQILKNELSASYFNIQLKTNAVINCAEICSDNNIKIQIFYDTRLLSASVENTINFTKYLINNNIDYSIKDNYIFMNIDDYINLFLKD